MTLKQDRDEAKKHRGWFLSQLALGRVACAHEPDGRPKPAGRAFDEIPDGTPLVMYVSIENNEFMPIYIGVKQTLPPEYVTPNVTPVERGQVAVGDLIALGCWHRGEWRYGEAIVLTLGGIRPTDITYRAVKLAGDGRWIMQDGQPITVTKSLGRYGKDWKHFDEVTA